MDVSIGVIAHNEEKIIARNLESLTRQKTGSVNIKEIIVVSSSNDNTNRIVKDFDVGLIIEPKRQGKAHAVNAFMKAAKSKYLILCSGDVVPKRDAVENICRPLRNRKVGIVACRPIPVIRKRFVDSIVKLQWLVHHRLSLKYPKYGEMIAFRNIVHRIDNTAADEEFIAMLIYAQGYVGAYQPKSVVYNTGPDTINDFLKQKRRIYWGHLELKKKYNYIAASMRLRTVIVEYLKCLSLGIVHVTFMAAFFESMARMLGLTDYYANRDHYIWELIKSDYDIDNTANL